MTWLQLLAQAGVMATFFGLALAAAAYFNGKHIKEGISQTGKMLQEEGRLTREMIQQEGKLTREMIQQEGKLTRQLLDKIDDRAQQRQQEVINKFAG